MSGLFDSFLLDLSCSDYNLHSANTVYKAVNPHPLSPETNLIDSLLSTYLLIQIVFVLQLIFNLFFFFFQSSVRHQLEFW